MIGNICPKLCQVATAVYVFNANWYNFIQTKHSQDDVTSLTSGPARTAIHSRSIDLIVLEDRRTPLLLVTNIDTRYATIAFHLNTHQQCQSRLNYQFITSLLYWKLINSCGSNCTKTAFFIEYCWQTNIKPLSFYLAELLRKQHIHFYPCYLVMYVSTIKIANTNAGEIQCRFKTHTLFYTTYSTAQRKPVNIILNERMIPRLTEILNNQSFIGQF